MKLSDLSKDIWSIIGMLLSKRDLIALRGTCRILRSILDKIDCIWIGKHYDYYRHSFVFKRNNRQIIRNNYTFLDCLLNFNTIVLIKPEDRLGRNGYSRHQDTIHQKFTCHVCDFSFHQLLNEYGRFRED